MKIVIIGAGNVGVNLLAGFTRKNIIIEQIAGRDRVSLQAVSQKYNVNFTDNLNTLSGSGDLYIVTVNDQSIVEVLAHIPENKLVVHTSGSVGIDVLDNFEKFGVFYPLQTFSKEKIVDLENVPVCIEGNDRETVDVLTGMAKKIAKNIYYLDSEQRKYLHLAAVFASNFTNYMYAIAEEILAEKSIPKEIIFPLIEETAEKFKNINAREAQTGPAKRNDENIIKKQLDLLSSKPELKELYQLISKKIQDYHDEEF